MYQQNPTATKFRPPKERPSSTLLSSEIRVGLLAQRGWTFLSYGFIITQTHSSAFLQQPHQIFRIQDHFPSTAQSKSVSAPVFTHKGVVLTFCVCLDCLKHPAASA